MWQRDEFKREEAIREVLEINRKIDQDRKIKSKEMFTRREGLTKAIEEEIYPTIVTIKTEFGVIGTGFFQHSKWLVSNAHIIRSSDVINGARLIDYQSHSLVLAANSSYHRPDKDGSPDVVIIETDSRHNGNGKSLPTEFNGDQIYINNTYVFYVAPRLGNPGQFDIKYLHLCSVKDTYPLLYVCLDGSIPEPGCSGAPIIEARVVVSNHETKWQFRVVGILYARCTPDWAIRHLPSGIVKNPEKLKWVCVIPVIQEFTQILQMLFADQQAIRYRQMADASKRLGDDQSERNSDKYLDKSREIEALKKLKLFQYQSGDTPLDISLPDGLEKLYYPSVVALDKSLLLEKARRSEMKKDARKYSGVTISFEELKADFDKIVMEVTNSGPITLRAGDSLYSTKYFRIDVAGGSTKEWILDIQDNIEGRYKGKPLSSKFAIVKIPREIKAIEGKGLAALFQQSQDKIRDVPFSGPIPSPSSSLPGALSKKGLAGISPDNLSHFLKIPPNLIIDPAIKEGVYFFEAFARVMNSLHSTTDYNETDLRLACSEAYSINASEFKSKNDELKNTASSEKISGTYDNDIKYTEEEINSLGDRTKFIPGSYNLEGKLLCRYYQLPTINVVEIDNKDKGELIAKCYSVTGYSVNEITRSILFESGAPILIVFKNDSHFIPILQKTPVLQDAEQALPSHTNDNGVKPTSIIPSSETDSTNTNNFNKEQKLSLAGLANKFGTRLSKDEQKSKDMDGKESLDNYDLDDLDVEGADSTDGLTFT